MKTILNTLFIGCVAFLVSCSTQSFEPIAHANPWVDDYSALSGMENYKQWGTSNLHHPSCLLIGDT